MYTLKLSLMETVQDSLRTLMLDICNIVYKLIAFCYEVLYKLGTINLLQDEAVQNLISRVTLIIGIFMVFRVTFAFVQYIVDPDAMLDKSKGVPSIVKKIIISIVLLGSTPYLFSMAFKIQKTVLDSHVLERLIFANDTIDTSTFGGVISSTVFTTFYRINEGPSNPNVQTYVDCKEIVNEYLDNEISTSNGSLDLAYACLLERTDYPANPVDKNKKVSSAYIVDFDGGGTLALVAGLVTLYISFLFTLQIGVRMFQLAYLQMVSPIPIAMYITPKGDDQLKKWGQQCLTTFLDLFLRIIIIYLAMFLIEVVRDNNDFKTLFGGGALYNTYVTCILMIAILIFAKKIPNLLKEIFPSLGGAAGFSYSLKMPDEAKKVGLFGVGAALGAAGAAASNMLYGAGNIRKNWKENEGTTGQKLWQATKGVFGTGASMIGGAASGLNKGRKIKDLKGVRGVVQQTNDNRDKRDLKQAAGYTAIDRLTDSISGFAGLDTKAEGMIKEAQWQQQAAEASKAALWKSTEDAVKEGSLTYETYSLARSIRQTKDANGKIKWKGLDRTGHEFVIDDANLESTLSNMKFKDKDAKYMGTLANAIRQNAVEEKKIKDEGKKIKGLEAAKNDAKK